MLERIWKLLPLNTLVRKLKIMDLLQSLPDWCQNSSQTYQAARWNLKPKNEHLHITSGKFSSVINGVVADEYPELPTIAKRPAMQYEIDVEDLKKAIIQTKLAVSSDVTRAVLTGVYWHNYEGSLYLLLLMATDWQKSV